MLVNSKISIHAYKFNGFLYRTFEFPKIIFSNDKIIILDLTNSKVISDGRNKKFYYTCSKNKSFWIMFKDEWYNLIVTQKDGGKMMYYFNIATPFIYEDETIKYIDLDLDVRGENINENTERFKILDRNEFLNNSRKMFYPKKLISKAISVKDELISKLSRKEFQIQFNNLFFAKLIKNKGKQ